jgi:hypothetical protein
MAMQTTQTHLAQLSRPASASRGPGVPTAILVSTCLIAALLALSLVAQRYAAVGAAPSGFDDNRAWIVGP